jgi:hypothetical protein
MFADVLSDCGLLINTNLQLERGIFDGESRVFEKIESGADVRRADQRHEI